MSGAPSPIPIQRPAGTATAVAPPGGTATASSSPNPAPAQAALATFIFREVLSVLFVAVWLLLFAGELLTARYVVPLWFHCLGVGVMAYALGINVAELTAFRPPGTAAAVLQR